jgi:hypothetical protein
MQHERKQSIYTESKDVHKKLYSKLSPRQLMGGVLILPEPKNAKKKQKIFHLKNIAPADGSRQGHII